MALDQVRTSDETVLETLANWAADVPVHWPELAVDRSARAFEDTIACMIAGADDLSPVKTRKGIANWGTGSSTVVGQSTGAPAPWAAMANGAAAHALDYDDNVTIVLGHTSAVQVPALLALGAVYVALFLGWNFLEMLCYAIFASACAFAGGLIGGWLESKVGVKRALLVEIMLMVLAGLTQLSITRESLFLGLIENSQVWDGPVFQTLSDIVYLSLISVVAITVTASISSGRTMLVTLAPPGRSGEFFGLYAIAGTITVWMGPLLVEQFTLWSGDQRIGMVSINILFIIGFVTLLTVRMPERAA